MAVVRDFGIHDNILDAGGGTGELAFALLRANPSLMATVMDLPEVVSLAEAPGDIKRRCQFIPADFFEQWPVRSDAVVLARVLHDWPNTTVADLIGGVCSGIVGLWLGGGVSTATSIG